MRTWRVLLKVSVLAVFVVAFAAPPVSATARPNAPTDIRLTVRSGDDLVLEFDEPSNGDDDDDDDEDDGRARIREYQVRVDGRQFSIGTRRNVRIRNVDDPSFT